MSNRQVNNSTTRPSVILIAAAVLLAACVGGVWLFGVLPLRARSAAQGRALEAAIADFHQQRWARPVLRGEAREGNAFDAQEAASFHVDDADHEILASAVEAGGARDPRVQALLAEHREQLDSYRAATHHAWSWGDHPVEDGMDAAQMNLLDHIQLVRLLTLTAMEATPEECLEIGTDVIRLGQDRAAGRSLVALMVHRAGVADIFDVLPRCLLQADPGTIRQATRELEILATHPAPTGYAMEIEQYYAAVTFAHELRFLDHLPTDRALLQAWFDAPDTLEAWDVLGGDPVGQRQVGEDYPADIARYEAWATTVGSSSNRVLSVMTPALARILREDAATRTRVEILWAMARLRSGEARTLFLDPRLLDPLTGAALETRETSAGLEIRSAGADGVWGPSPDGGESDDAILLVPPMD